MKFVAEGLRLAQGAFRVQIDFAAEGRCLGIFGPSGAGKTTFLEIIAGLRRPAAGRVSVDGADLANSRAQVFLPPEKRGVGYVPQDLALFPHLAVRKNLLYGRRKDGPDSITLEHVAAVLSIDALLDRPIAQLSGGQKQRVAFGRALLSAPHLLLLDEPLSGLDHDLRLTVIPYLQRIRDEFGIPMIYVSHSPDEIVALCDQVVVLRAGKNDPPQRPENIFEATTSIRLKPGFYESDK